MKPTEEDIQKFYRSPEWRAVRLAVLVRDHYLDQTELANGRLIEGNTVHHIIPLREDWSKRLDMNNLETITASNHNREHREKGSANPSTYLITERRNQGIIRRNRESIVKPEINDEL